jgi:membrane protein DedA with SNARE-associated domain
MMNSPEQLEDTPTRDNTRRPFRERITSKNGILLILVITLMIGGSIALYLADIDWEQQIIRYRYFGIFVLMLVSSMTILLPLPGVAALAVAPSVMNLTGNDLLWLAVVASIGGTLGELTSYFAGRWGRGVITEKQQKGYGRVERWMKRYGGFSIFVFALIPFPFDIVGIVAGSLWFPLWKFLFFCWAGRLIKYTFVVYLGYGLSGLGPF